MSLASLRELEERTCIGKVGIERFRPNIVFDGPVAPGAENKWCKGTLAGIEFAEVQQCRRCGAVDLDGKPVLAALLARQNPPVPSDVRATSIRPTFGILFMHPRGPSHFLAENFRSNSHLYN